MKHLFAGAAAVLVLAFLLTACDGGGGGGTPDGTDGGATKITYSGVTTPAAMTVANANLFFSLLWNGGGTSSETIANSAGAAKAGLSGDSQTVGIVPIAKELAKRVTKNGLALAVQEKTPRSIVPINETYSGMVSGTLTITGSLDDTTGTGTIIETYVNFNDGDGYTDDGAITVRVDGYDMATGVMTDATMSFTLWTIKSAGSDVSLSGSIMMQSSVTNKSETMTINIDGSDNIGKETFRFANLVLSNVYDSLLFPTSATGTYSGRIYLEKYGYAEISTVTPCLYTDPNSDPSSGGPIILAGAGNSRASVTPLSGGHVKIEVDDDGDTVFEGKNAYAWSDLGGAPACLPPVANAGSDQAVYTGTTVTLNASGSSDLLGDPLTYMWTLTAKPVGSKAVLSASSAMMTSFYIDLPGTYTATLVVNNGTTSSSIDEVVIIASGPASFGLFKPYVGYQAGSLPMAVAIGDVNGDGKNDVVLSTTATGGDLANDYHIFVFLQNASGGFDQAVKYPVGNGNSGPMGDVNNAVAIGDLNNDGRLDVVVTADNGIGVFCQNSSGGLNPMVSYASSHQGFSKIFGLKIGDLNHDGLLDVVSISSATPSLDVDVFYQNAGGTFNPPVTYTVDEYGGDDPAVGDVNNDGLMDIIIISGYLHANFGVLTQNTDGTFNPAAYYSIGPNELGSFADNIAVGDVSGDALEDVVITYGGNAGRVGVFRQNNAGTLDSIRSYLSYDCPDAVEIADVNSDGRKDIIVAHPGWMKLGVYLQGPDGELLPEDLYPVPYGTNDLAVGDINGDGLKDVVIADSGDDDLIVLYQK